MLYKNFGFSIDSDIELPFLTNDNVNEKSDIQISKMINKPELTEPIQIYSVNVSDSTQLVCKVMEHSKLLILDFDNHICFRYKKENDRYVFNYYCYEKYQKDAMERLIGRFGMTYLLTWMGMTVLHGSAVINREQAICFLANSGGGKSSMAGLFVANGSLLMADELIVLKPYEKKAMLLPSSPYLQLSDESLQKIPLSNYPQQRIVVKFDNNGIENVETTNRVDLQSACVLEPYRCSKFIILDRGHNGEIKFQKHKKIDAYLSLLRFLYTPIIFPFMRKNLLTLMDFIELEQVCFSDCFNQFEDMKSHIEQKH